jgi:3-isopropylmalate dehydrogenase
MLFEWLSTRHARNEFAQAANAIESAVDTALKSRDTRTRDLGGNLNTDAFAKHIVQQIG